MRKCSDIITGEIKTEITVPKDLKVKQTKRQNIS